VPKGFANPLPLTVMVGLACIAMSGLTYIAMARHPDIVMAGRVPAIHAPADRPQAA
jgi:hypothetical protein